MWIITDYNNVVILEEDNEIKEDQYYYIVQYTYMQKEFLHMYKVDSIPTEMPLIRWCYTPEKGFYPNPLWRPDKTEQYLNLCGEEDLFDSVQSRKDIQTALSFYAVNTRMYSNNLNENTTLVVDNELFYDNWKSGTTEEPAHYEVNMFYRYEDQIYKCIQEHDNHGEEGWEPSKSQALFTIAHTKNKANPKKWVQPLGAHDAYMTDEVCTYEGKVYISLVNNNVWIPNQYPTGWKEVITDESN